MKCAHHMGQDAVGTCQQCQKGLCNDCMRRFNKPLCDVCLAKQLSTETHQFYIGVAITIVLFIVGYYVWARYMHGGIFYSLIPGAVFGGLYWGWRFLTDTVTFKPSNKPRRWWMNILVHGGYNLVKLIIALIIGVFVGMYKIGQGIQKLRQARLLKQQISVT